jgi:arabinogalactan oligomer/maltooligosaccharide transport system permease protein
LSPRGVVAAEPIRLWHAYRGEEEAALRAIVSTWDGGPVEMLAVPYDAYGSKLASAIPLGEGPHLFIDAHERLGDYRQRKIVAVAAEAFETDAFDPYVRESVTLDGEVWAIPLSLKCMALYVNDDLVEVSPADFESIQDVAAGLPTGSYALVYEARNPYAHAPILHAFGGRMLTEDGEFGFVGPEAVRSLEFVAAWQGRGVVPEDADGALATNLFRSGRAAFALSGPWLAADIGDAVPYHVEPLPILRETGRRLAPYVTVESLMLSPHGASRSDVLALAYHLASAAASKTRAERARSLTARNDVPLRDDALLAAFAEQARHGVVTPSASAMRATWEPARRAMRKVLGGDADPAAALEEAKRRFDDVRRPPPPPAPWWPGMLILGAVSLLGAAWMLQRAGESDVRKRIAASLPAYAWVAHAVLAVGVLVILPLVVGAATSLVAGPTGDVHYVGAANFVRILTARGGPLLATGSFYVVLAVTVLWTVLNVVMHVGIGLSLGLLLSRPQLRFKPVYRVLLIVPWAVPSYVTALAWKGMFHRQFGAVTGMIEWLNEAFGLSLEPISWFSNFTTAFTANLATNVWLGFPFMMVVTLGALTSVPRDVLEAAEVDGATRWQRLTRVTLPIIRPTLMPAVTLGAIWTFNMFNVVFLVSGGDPDGTTDILVSEAYRWAFTREAQYGYAAAYAVLIFLLLFGVTKVLDRLQSRWTAQRGGPS